MCRKCELAARPCAQTLGSVQKLANLSQPFVDQSSPNLGVGHVGESLYIDDFFEIFSVKVENRSPSQGEGPEGCAE